MSWQLSLSITGTETWCRMFGTPPPDHYHSHMTTISSVGMIMIGMRKMTLTILKSSPSSDYAHGVQELLVVVPEHEDDGDGSDRFEPDVYLGIQMGTTWGCLSIGFSSSRIAMSFSKVGAW